MTLATYPHTVTKYIHVFSLLLLQSIFRADSKRMEHMNITCLPEKKAHTFSSWRVIAIVISLNILRCYLHTHTVGNIDVNGPATHKKMTAFFRALHCRADNKSIHFTVKFEVSINDMRLQWEHIVGFGSHFIAPKAFVVRHFSLYFL